MARNKTHDGPVCVWTLDAHTDAWDTACGETFVFLTDGPRENGMRFCGYCGRELKEVSERTRGEVCDA